MKGSGAALSKEQAALGEALELLKVGTSAPPGALLGEEAKLFFAKAQETHAGGLLCTSASTITRVSTLRRPCFAALLPGSKMRQARNSKINLLRLRRRWCRWRRPPDPSSGLALL